MPSFRMALSGFERSLDDVVETLRNARGRGRGCSLLIGAGCSATSDIPLAGGIVQEFARQYPRRYERVAVKTYPHCMAELAYNERSDLIAPYIDKAKINWAHVAIAQLTRAGYVTRILTTNFDPLLGKACATVGVFPAIYDLAASRVFKADRVYEPAVFYLHGQRAGFVTLHTDHEVQRHKETLGPVFEDAGKGRPWIVCGYSGDNDPVFEHLAAVPAFDSNLYWVGYKDTPPSEHVRRLLVEEKYAFHVSGYDADGFFVELARQLDCFPPALIAKPFTHLLEVTDLLAPFTIGQVTSTDLREVARTRIRAAIDQFETGEAMTADTAALQPEALDANALLLSGKYEEVLSLFRATANPSEELRDAAAWSLISQGNALSDPAGGETGSASSDALEAAVEKYEEALRINPDLDDALYNWGNALYAQARTRHGAEAESFWQAAGEKYREALRIKSDKHQALNNWGVTLAGQARMKGGVEAEELWQAACEKYGKALHIKPDKHEVFNNWGNALDAQARMKNGAAAETLWEAATEKYLEALRIKPDYHEALTNWGITLDAHARTKSGTEADALWEAASEKYGEALRIKSDDYKSLSSWGNMLDAQARTKSGAEAQALLEAASEKYGEALRIKPDDHETLTNWATALLRQSAGASPEERHVLVESAIAKCEAANTIVSGSASYNLACAYSLLGDAESCRTWLLDSKTHGKLPSREHLLNDPDLAGVRDLPWFAELLESQ
jgi:tetratricopeptide (TPR) repeat protein/NAD-dependent SIR2 family protein deacetylase